MGCITLAMLKELKNYKKYDFLTGKKMYANYIQNK